MKHDVIILGGGIIGATLAWYLTEAGPHHAPMVGLATGKDTGQALDPFGLERFAGFQAA